MPVRGHTSFALRMIPSSSGIRSRYGSVDPGSVLRAMTKSSGILILTLPASCHPGVVMLAIGIEYRTLRHRLDRQAQA